MISFIHAGGPSMASYRYRAEIPAKSLDAEINKYPADILIFVKPLPHEVTMARRAQVDGYRVVADFCDDHFDWPHYSEMAELCDLVTCSTPAMAERIPVHAEVIPDTFEFEELEPHCNGGRLLWFGHASNIKSIRRLNIAGVRIVSNVQGAIQWDIETLKNELRLADIVLMPATAAYKSPNRTLEAIRMGCFVVAEPHPSLVGFPIWIGDISEGILWARRNRAAANRMIKAAQQFVREKYSPKIQAAAWKRALATLN